MLILATLALAAPPLRPDLPPFDAAGVAWSADRSVALTWGAGRVDLRRGTDGRLLASHAAESVVAAALSPDGRFAWIGGRTLSRWDLQTETWTETTAAPPLEDLVHLEVSPGGDRLLRMAGRTYSDTGVVELLDMEGRAIVSVPVGKASTGWHHAAAFDPRPSAHRVLLAAGSKVLAVDTTSGEVRTLAEPRGGASVLAWRPGGTSIAVAGYGARAVMVDADSGEVGAFSPRCRFLGESTGRQRWKDLAWSADGARVAGVCEAGGGARVLTWAPDGVSEPATEAPRAESVVWAGDQLLATDRVGGVHRIVEGALADAGDLVPVVAPGGPVDFVTATLPRPTGPVSLPVGRASWAVSENPGWTAWRTGDEEHPLDLAHLSLGAPRPVTDAPRFDRGLQAFTLPAPLGVFPAGARLPIAGATEARIERGPWGPFVAAGELILANAAWEIGDRTTHGLVAWNRQGVAWMHPSSGRTSGFEVVGDRVLVDARGTVTILDAVKGTTIATLPSPELAGRHGWTWGVGSVVNVAGTELWIVNGPGKGIYDLRTGKRTGTPPDGVALPPSQGKSVFADQKEGCVGADKEHCVPLTGLAEGHGVVVFRWSADGSALIGLDMFRQATYAWTPSGEPLPSAPTGGTQIQPEIFARSEGSVLLLSRAKDGAALRVAVGRSGRLLAWSEPGFVQAAPEDLAVRDGTTVRAPTEAERGWARDDLVSLFLAGAPLPEAPR